MSLSKCAARFRKTPIGGGKSTEKAPDNKMFYRSFELNREAVNEKERSVAVSFSSEDPVYRWGADEILLHGSKNVNLARLKSMGAALLGHNASIIVGALNRVRVEDRRGTAVIKFDDDEDGQKALGKVNSGSLKGVSVGFLVEKAAIVEDGEEWQDPETKKNYKGPAFIATRWTPYEISLTPIPADATVGVGRSLDGIDIERQNLNQEEQSMEKKEVGEMIDAAVAKIAAPATAAEIAVEVRGMIAEDAKPKMNVSVEQSRDLIARAGAVSPECRTEVTDLVFDGKTEPEILKVITDRAVGKPDAKDTGDTGTGLKTGDKAPTGPVSSFKQVEDEDFFRGIANPATMPMQ